MASRIPWFALGGALSALSLAVLAPLLRKFPFLAPACPLKALTGLPCATCGLTRCLLALSEGRWLEAFYWHPVAFVLLALAPAGVVWDLWRAGRGTPYPPLPEHRAARALVGTVLVGAWALQILRGI